MTEIVVDVPSTASRDFVTEAIDVAISAARLKVTLRDTLSRFPGCIHWHLKQGKGPGTLEVTFWPEQNRLWFSVHKNRSAPWIEEEIPRLNELIVDRFTT